MFWVYVLKSEDDDKLYTGYTGSPKSRFNLHRSGKVYSTKFRGNFKLIYIEGGLNETDAKKRERFLKSGPGKRYLKSRLKYFSKEPWPVRS